MKAKQELLAMFLVGLAFVGSGYAASPAKKPTRDFSLTISAKDRVVKIQNDMDISINVRVRNTSLHTVAAGRWFGDPGVCYRIDVLRNGHPAPMTEDYRDLLTPEKSDPGVVWTGSFFFVPIKPFRSRTFEIPLTRYFELNAPGKYEIAFTAGSDPGQPDNVDIRSNTITLTVDPAEAQ